MARQLVDQPKGAAMSSIAVQTGVEAPRYALDSSWKYEHRRLRLLEQVFDPHSIVGLETVGVAPGARCLELGAGVGSIASWLCRQVGRTGPVTATDLDTRWLGELSQPNLTVLHHDLLVDEFPDGSFDVIH